LVGLQLTPPSPARRLLAFASGHWRIALLQFLLAVCGTLLMFVFPGVMQWFIDDIIPNKRADLIWQAAGLALAAHTGRDFLFYLRTRVNAVFEQRMIYDLRARLHRKIARMGLAWFDQRSSGDVLTRMAEDVPATQRVVLEGIEQGVTAILQIVITAVVMFLTNAPLTWLILLPTPLLAAGGWIYSRLLAPRARLAREASGEMNAMLFDTVAGIRQIKSYTYEDGQQERFNTTSRGLRAVQLRMMSAAAVYGPLMSFLGSTGLVILLAFGSAWCVEETLSLGELMKFILLTGFLYEPITRLHGVNQNLVTGMASARRVFEVLDETGEEDLEAGVPLGEVRGEIRFEEVIFGYGPSRTILRGVSLEVRPQQTVAIVGATGSGKSTVFQLLNRFYDPQGGSILLDGKPLTDFSKISLRDAISYVTQDAFLFATTVRGNLLLGKHDATDEEIWSALRLACADEFVQRLEGQLDHEVGERGMRLSGGERQRLAMARAFLKDAPILLLDEATSAVDNKSEHLIQEALEKLRQNRTCLVIAHRLSTIVEADRIYVMRDGEVLGHGKHEELIETSPYYAELAHAAFAPPGLKTDRP
jgi:ATP-binding cassette subfamily B protein/subfamily B ATP-binding cassette protein MsbA